MKEKGFTLIELLAVIVILAIIALIATPLVLNTIEEARKGAAKSSTYGYIEAIEQEIALAMMNNYESILTSDNDNIDITELEDIISIKGTTPTGGVISIKNGMVTTADICISGYEVEYVNSKATVISKCDGNYDITQGLRERVLTLYKDEISNAVNYFIVYNLGEEMSADLILYDENYNFKLSVIDDTDNIPFFRLDLVNDSLKYKIASGVTMTFDGTLQQEKDSYRTFEHGYQFHEDGDQFYIEFFGYPDNIDDFQVYKSLFNKIVYKNTDIQLEDIITLPESYNNTVCRDYMILTYGSNAQFYCFTGNTGITYVPDEKEIIFNYNGDHIYRFKYDTNGDIIFDTDLSWVNLINTTYKNNDILDIIVLSTLDITDSSGNVYYKANTTVNKLNINYTK